MELILKAIATTFGQSVLAWLAIILTIVVIVPGLYVIARVILTSKSFKLFGIEITRSVDENKKKMVTSPAEKAVDTHWKTEIAPGEEIGFIVPRDTVYVYGKFWDKVEGPEGLTSVNEGIDALADKWESRLTKINLVDANVISPMISVINKKLSSIPHITIICSVSQEKLLHYFQGNENVTIEAR